MRPQSGLLITKREGAEAQAEIRAGRRAVAQRVHPIVHHRRGRLPPVPGQSHGAEAPGVPGQDLRQGHLGRPGLPIPLALRVHPGVREDHPMEEVIGMVIGRSAAMAVSAATARVPLNDGFWLALL